MGITFQCLFEAESDILDKFLDKKTLGKHDYCISKWKCAGYSNDPISLEEIIIEVWKLKTGKAAGKME